MMQDSNVLWLEKAIQARKWIDQSKYNNNGAMIGALFKHDNIYFDGIDDYVDCGKDASFNTTQAITVEAWVKEYSSSHTAGVVGKDRCFYIAKRTTTGYYFNVYIDGAFRGNDVVFNPSINEWYHLLMSYDSVTRTLKSYVDAVLGNTTVFSGLASYTINTSIDHVMIGFEEHFSTFFNGYIAVVRIYNTTLSAQQTKEVFEQSYRLV